MTKPGQRQKTTAHRVLDPRTISPDDVRALELQRDQRFANDRRSAAQVYLGEPETGRSAWDQMQATRRAHFGGSLVD